MLLKQLFEDDGKKVTFCFGRFNPPTIGHKQVFETMKKQGGDMMIFTSTSQDKKKNPLDYSTKIDFLKKILPDYASYIVEDASLNTIDKVAAYLNKQGYTDATFVAGSDRLDAMAALLQEYNGKTEGKKGPLPVTFKFKNLDFVSSGEREDGAEGVAGISASGAREAALQGDFDAFEKATGAGEHAQGLYDAVRNGMGISEDLGEGKFRERDIEEKLIPNKKLNDLKSKYLPDWEMLDHRILQAKYVAKDHRHAEKFVSYINKVSERMDHFAEVTQDVAEVTVKTTTFDVKGLTILDFKLALKVDKFAKSNDIEQVRMQGNFGMHETSMEEDWRKKLAAAGMAGMIGLSGAAGAADRPSDTKKEPIVATIVIDGETKTLDLTPKGFNDVRDAEKWLDKFLDDRGIVDWRGKIERSPGSQGDGTGRYQRILIQ